MLTIYRYEKGGSFISALSCLVAQEKKCLLLVPEQQTVRTEAYMASLLPPSAPRFFEVSNFTRLANTVFRAVGGLCYNYADAATESVFLWKTMDAVAPLLHEKNTRAGHGRVKEYRAAIGEISAAGISFADLDAAAKKLPKDNPLRDRLEDLALILRIWQGEIKENYGRVSEDLDRLGDILAHTPFFADTEIFIDSFTSFTEQQYRILQGLIRGGKVTVSLVLPTFHADMLCYEENAETWRRLCDMARKSGVAWEEKSLADTQNTDMLSYAAKEVFRADRRILPYGSTEDDSVRIYDAPDPFDACDAIASDICEKVLGGVRYRDIAIVARHAEAYAGILDVALAKAGIPVFFSVKKDVSTFALIKMIRCLYAMVTHGYRKEDVIAYLKCGFTGLCAEDIDLFEIYIDRWNIHGSRFTQKSEWKMSPDGYTDRAPEQAAEILARVNAVKTAALAPVVSFAELLKGTVTVQEHAKALFAFLSTVKAEEQVLLRAEQAEKAGMNAEGQMLRRLFPALCDILDLLYAALGDMPMEADRFADLLQMLFDTVDLGQIPTGADEATVGSADLLRADGASYVYLLGVNEGEFPAAVQEGGLFNEGERAILSSLGLALAPSLAISASREEYCFLRALQSAKKQVSLYTFAQTAAGSACHAAQVVLRLAAVCGIEPIRTDALPSHARIFRAGAAAEQYALWAGTPTGDALQKLLEQTEAYASLIQRAEGNISDTECRLSEALAKELFPDKLNLTQSRLDAYQNCPFAYYCRYVLGLNEDRQATFDALSIGNLMHALLEAFFVHMQKAGHTIKTFPPSDIPALIDRISLEYAEKICPEQEASTPRMQHLFLRLKRTAGLLAQQMYREFAQSEFEPSFFELGIGKADTPSPLISYTEDGASVALYGTVDRVDLYHAPNGVCYVRVIDYKTGTKSFSLKDVERGRNLQMLLYLFSIWKTEKPAFLSRMGLTPGEIIRPAGVLYVSASPKDLRIKAPMGEDDVRREVTDNLKKSGLLLQDEQVLRAMDATLSGKYIPIKTTKNGEIKYGESFVSLADMGRLVGEIDAIVGSIGTRMRQGRADAHPADKKDTGGKQICESCAMRPICRRKS